MDQGNQIRRGGKLENRNETQIAACVDTNGNKIQDASRNYHDGDAKSGGHRDLGDGNQSRPYKRGGKGRKGEKTGRKAQTRL